MHKISILAVGRLKEKHWLAAQDEFSKRLSPFAKLEIIEVRPASITASRGAEQSRREEGVAILRRLPADGLIIAADRLGARLSSEQLAGFLKEEGGRGQRLVFIVGGAAGLDQAVLARAGKKISLSEMTFTHEMARLILLEQLYRAETILAGKAYHY